MELNEHLSDKAKYDLMLVTRALESRDQKAYEELMSRYRESIFFLILRMVNNDDDAEDLMMVTFAKAFHRLHQYTPQFAFSTWLFKIATNNCIDFLRKKRIKAMSIDQGIATDEGDYMEFNIRDTDGLNPEEEMQKQQRMILLRGVVEKLKPRYRRLIEMRYYQELAYEEIATELDLPLGTVKAQLFRAKAFLNQLLKNTGDSI
jgi:RNA polymerase sigma factor (sigma-70 family)